MLAQMTGMSNEGGVALLHGFIIDICAKRCGAIHAGATDFTLMPSGLHSQYSDSVKPSAANLAEQ